MASTQRSAEGVPPCLTDLWSSICSARCNTLSPSQHCIVCFVVPCSRYWFQLQSFDYWCWLLWYICWPVACTHLPPMCQCDRRECQHYGEGVAVHSQATTGVSYFTKEWLLAHIQFFKIPCWLYSQATTGESVSIDADNTLLLWHVFTGSPSTFLKDNVILMFNSTWIPLVADWKELVCQ